MKILGILILSIFLVSCTRDAGSESENGRVQFQLPQTAKPLKTNASTSATNTTWGMSQPSNFSEINCYALMVAGPDIPNVICRDSTGLAVEEAAILIGGFPAGSLIDVELPSGEARKFSLVGMYADSAAACSDLFFGIQKPMLSEPMIVSQAKTDLPSGGVVELNMQVNVNPSLSFKDCDGPMFGEEASGDGGSQPSPPISNFQITSPSPGDWITPGNRGSFLIQGSCVEDESSVDLTQNNGINNGYTESVPCTGGIFTFELDLNAETTDANDIEFCLDHASETQVCVILNNDAFAPNEPSSATFPSSPSNDTTPDITLMADSGDTVRLYSDNICSTEIGSAVAVSFSATITVNTALPEGSPAIYSRAEAPSGLLSNCSSDINASAYTIDTTPPPQVTILGISGTTTDDNAMDTTLYGFEAIVHWNDVAGATNYSVNLWNSGFTTILCTMNINSGVGSAALTDNACEVDPGFYIAEVRANDAVGNFSSETLTFSVQSPQISITDKSVIEGTTASVDITLSHPAKSNVTVQLSTADNTALQVADYTAKSQTVTFLKGVKTQTVNITTNDDSLDEPNSESFYVNLTSPSANATISDNQAVVTITDNDTAPTVTIAGGPYTIGEDFGDANISISLSAASAMNISLDYNTADGSAIAGTDYTATSGTLNFAPGETSKNIPIPLINDLISNGSRSFSLSISNFVNVSSGGVTTETITIADDEALPTIGTWAARSTGTPAARTKGTSVWTGRQALIWGGSSATMGTTGPLNTGYSYHPETALGWASAIPTTGAPSARFGHSAIWTGARMIVWGGENGSSRFDNGGIYNPANDTWTAMAPLSDLVANEFRANHSAVWTGRDMIIWGGQNTTTYQNDGFRYNLAADSWTAISTTGAPTARAGHAAVWTGKEMIIYGGYNDSGPAVGDKKWIASNNTWVNLSTTNKPSARRDFAWAWSGEKLFIWGGNTGSVTDTGAVYDAAKDTWTPMAPSPLAARSFIQGVWTGSHFLVWGGQSGSTYYNDGALYDPVSDTWESISTSGAPSTRSLYTMEWTGDQLLIFSGRNGGTLETDGFTLQDIHSNNRVIDITQGNDFTCAHYNGGRVKCFGDNTYGQLGYENTTDLGGVPGEMNSLPFINFGTNSITSGPKKVIEMVSGGYHSCALMDDYNVYCWGNNSVGQLGLNPSTHPLVGDGAGEMTGILHVDTTMQARKIFAGHNNTCAILVNDRVECWGNNNLGQLANGSMTDTYTPTVMSLSGPSPKHFVTDIAMGVNNSCIISDIDELMCTGKADFGALGNGDTTTDQSYLVPVDITNFPTPNQRTFSNLSGEGDHFCLISFGTPYCWGKNSSGALSTGSTTNEIIPVAATIPADYNAQFVTAGLNHTCFLLNDTANNEVIHCNGINSTGVLGRNTSDNATMADIPVVDIGSSTDLSGIGISKIVGYDRSQCALYEDNKLRCWGKGGALLGQDHIENIGDGTRPMNELVASDVYLYP